MRFGELIRPLRAGDNGLAVNRVSSPRRMAVRSDAFTDGGRMPARFSVEGDGSTPGLTWEGVPTQTAELVLIVQDPDVPLLRPIVHAVVTGIAPDGTGLEQGAWERSGTFGVNTFRKKGFIAPAPIRGHGPHRYVFQLFAMSRTLGVSGVGLLAVLAAMKGSVVDSGVLTGLYERR